MITFGHSAANGRGPRAPSQKAPPECGGINWNSNRQKLDNNHSLSRICERL